MLHQLQLYRWVAKNQVYFMIAPMKQREIWNWANDQTFSMQICKE